MYRIMLTCAGGMSSSLIVQKMRDAAQEQNIEAQIWAVDVGAVEENLGKFDVVLLAPQVLYKKNSIKKIVGDTPIDIIAPNAYGMCDGKAVLKQAISLINK